MSDVVSPHWVLDQASTTRDVPHSSRSFGRACHPCLNAKPTEDDDRTWWATPGGGLEGDETFERAAVREAVEELAIEIQSPLPLWSTTVEFSFRGQLVRQTERYFLIRLPDTDILSPSGPVEDVHRSEGIVATRWWTLEDVENTAEVVFPEDLCERRRTLGFRRTVSSPSEA